MQLEEDLATGLRHGMDPEEAQAHYNEICKFKNPITGETGKKVSSKKMS